MDDIGKTLVRHLQDPEFRKEWDASEEQYQITMMLINARIEAGMTQEELAKRSGVRHSTISRIENGNCMPTVKTLKALASGMGKKLVISLQ